MVSEPACRAALSADCIRCHRAAEQVRYIADHGGIVIVAPDSTVWQMVSASRLAVAFEVGPEVFDARRENLHRHTPQGPRTPPTSATSRNPHYALRTRKNPIVHRIERTYYRRRRQDRLDMAPIIST